MDSPAGILLGILLIIAGLVYGFWRNGDAYSLPSRSRRPKQKNPDNSDHLRKIAQTVEPDSSGCEDPLPVIAAVFEKYVGKDFSSPVGNHSIGNITKAIYRKDSEVWLKYAHRKVSDKCLLEDFPISTGQVDIMRQLFDNPSPLGGRITRCFSMILEIHAILKKGEHSGYYSAEQTVVLTGILLTDFARVVGGDKRLEAAFRNNPQVLDQYQRLWKPYEKFCR